MCSDKYTNCLKEQKVIWVLVISKFSLLKGDRKIASRKSAPRKIAPQQITPMR